MIRAKREPAAGGLRRHLDDVDERAEEGRGRGHRRHLRLPDDRAECRRRADSPEGDAGDAHDDRGDRRLDAGGLERGEGPAAAVGGRCAGDRGAWRKAGRKRTLDASANVAREPAVAARRHVGRETMAGI